MNWNEIERDAENLKEGILSIMSQIETLTGKNSKLPPLSATFDTTRSMIENPTYDVVVCGEVKKGKSSLLNAIIGQDILPVNVEIATSQVFRITNCETESFYLVFTDGTSKQISREELSRYGSQVDANLQGEPIFQNRQLEYIQVNIPVAFLPKGVNIVDTPGLGALYKSHEWITQNYVSKAAAVIFVMDPEKPLVEEEKAFILKVLDITPHILFAMTKIDMYTEDVIQSIVERDNELLRDIYAIKGITAPQIYPVSSKSLMKVSNGKIASLKESNLKNSHFTEFKEQLLYTIYKAVGLQQTGIALREVADQTMKCKKVLEDLLKVTSSENVEEQQRVNRKKAEKQDELNAEWGIQSKRRNEILQEIYDICSSLTSRVQQIVSTSGETFKFYDERINALENMDDAEKLANSMPQDLVNDVSSQWNNIAHNAEDKVIAVLNRVNAEINTISYGNVGGSNTNIETTDLTFNESFSAARSAIYLGGIGTSLAVSLGLMAIPVVGPIIGGIIGLGTLIFGGSQQKKSQLEKNKKNFHNKLIEILNELSAQLLHVQGDRNKSIVNEYAQTLKRDAEKAVQEIFEKQKKQMQNEIADLERQAHLDAVQRQEEMKTLTSEKSDWDNIVSDIKQLVSKRNQIANSLGLKTK